MKWQGRRGSENLIDKRGAKVGGGLGLIGIILGAVFVYLSGGNPLSFLLQNSDVILSQVGGNASTSDIDRKQQENFKKFVAVVLADTEVVWAAEFEKKNLSYPEPKLVVFTGRVESACGGASSAVGPFYCPGDSKIYLDLNFFNKLKSALGAEGDFPRAYVIAHEVGHHVQNILGINRKIRKLQKGLSKTESNKLSISMELQADCFSGLWANGNKRFLEEGDIQEGLNAASAIGDDKLQRESGGQVRPDSFTHGTSAQRSEAFHLGYEKGSFDLCINKYLASL